MIDTAETRGPDPAKYCFHEIGCTMHSAGGGPCICERERLVQEFLDARSAVACSKTPIYSYRAMQEREAGAKRDLAHVRVGIDSARAAFVGLDVEGVDPKIRQVARAQIAALDFALAFVGMPLVPRNPA